jgi:hypothetical protein
LRKLVRIFVAFLSLTVASTAWAADDSHTKSGGFFSFFRNLFHSGDSSDNRSPDAVQPGGATSQGAKKTKFIYLDDGSGTANDRGEVLAGPSLRFRAAPLGTEHKDAVTPNLLFEREVAGTGLHSPLSASHNFQKAGSKLSLTFPAADRKSFLSDLDISLTSRVAVQLPDGAGMTPGFNYGSSFDRRAYSLGVNADYKGFYAGASYGRQQDGLALGYHGYDVGIGYHGHKWSTGVQLSGYQKDDDILGLVGPDGIRVVQVGAAYSAGPWITFSGQFRYYDYNNRGSRDLLLDQSRVFTLGTSLNF